MSIDTKKLRELSDAYIGAGSNADEKTFKDASNAFRSEVGPFMVLALLNRIADLEEQLKTQARAALAGMDAAKRASTIQLDLADKARAESSPEALASERAANARLTEENEAHERVIARLQSAVAFWMPAIAGEEGPDSDRAAEDAMLLYGLAEDATDCYGDRMRAEFERVRACNAQGDALVIEMRAEIDALKPAANRYRFIRDDGDWTQSDRYWEALSAGGEKLDKTVDDGIKSRAETEEEEEEL